jgi:hypothetical protein
MKYLLKAILPIEDGNYAIKNGTMVKTIQDITAELKPESAYMTLEEGKRTIYCFFTMNQEIDMIKYTEPWFIALNAEVQIIPVMTIEEYKKITPQLENILHKYMLEVE